ncbi:hypothetical protein AAFF_G00053900 [Aldrovandia affinis]|uniref:Shootin-1 n=1 Tax=Aldrovandia affinis TaxID=143900 RepID=A0AAD7WEE9_9TELE|nr:hypothetical protein AAFF_G00053900 [Aldrovandia affinis]
MLPCPSSPSAVKEGKGNEGGTQKVKTEQCKRLTEERDEAERQLKHIKRVSQMVIEEVSVLQTQLEIEKSCRENAEALATKLNCENRKLKYLSLSSRPCLEELLPSISDCIALDEEAEPQDPSPDPYSQYQQQVKDLQETVNSMLEEKKQFACQLQEQRRQIDELTARSEKEQTEMKELYKTVEQQSKTIKRFNRVSVMAAHEYEGLRDQLDLEQSLREKAETYAHEMLVKQKEANRQSMILLQNADPSLQLLKALEDVANITKTLEQERLQHQQKVKSLEAELEECALRRQLEEVRKQLELLEEEKREVEGRLQEVEGSKIGLEGQVQELLAAQKSTDSAPGPAPGTAPPPLPHPSLLPLPLLLLPLPRLLPPHAATPSGSKGSLKAEQAPDSGGVDDVKVKAVNEMMERIKHGVVLRPVKGQDTKRFGIKHPPVVEEKPPESAMEELKGILETVKKSPSRGFPEVLLGKKDSELEVILRRRRKQACDPGSGDERDGQISKFSSSESLNARSSSDSGKEPDGPRNIGASGREPGGFRRGSDSGREPVVMRRSSDSSREPRGSWQSGSARSSVSEKGACEVVTNGCCDGEEEKQKAEKCTHSNGIIHTVLQQDKHTTLTPGSPAGPNPLNGSTDAEC